MSMLTSKTTAVVAAAAVTASVAAAAIVGVVSARHRRKRPVKLTRDNIQAFMKRIDAVVSDCDGVIWVIGQGPIPNARESMECLKAAGKKVLYATNNSVLGPLEKFRRLGYNVQDNEVVHPSMAITGYLQKIKFQKKCFVLAVEHFKNDMRRGGIRVLPAPKTGKLVDETLEHILKNIDTDPEVGAVVVDLDINMTYMDMNNAINHLMKPDCRLYAGATDTMVINNGRAILGPGPFLQILENATGKKAEVFGKPGSMMVSHFLKDEHNLNLRRTVFVGDTLVQDMGVANACGMVKLLVLTGSTRLSDLDECPEELIPDYYIDSIGDLAGMFKRE